MLLLMAKQMTNLEVFKQHSVASALYASNPRKLQKYNQEDKLVISN